MIRRFSKFNTESREVPCCEFGATNRGVFVPGEVSTLSREKRRREMRPWYSFQPLPRILKNICWANLTFVERIDLSSCISERETQRDRGADRGGIRRLPRRSCMYKRRDANNRAQITRNHRARGHQPSWLAKPRWILASRIFCPRTIPSIPGPMYPLGSV